MANEDDGPLFECFECFNDLPTELRVKIWKLSLPDPRVVKLEDKGSFMRVDADDLAVRLEHATLNPPHLELCKESREEALKVYRIFETIQSYHEAQGEIRYDRRFYSSVPWEWVPLPDLDEDEATRPICIQFVNDVVSVTDLSGYCMPSPVLRNSKKFTDVQVLAVESVDRHDHSYFASPVARISGSKISSFRG